MDVLNVALSIVALLLFAGGAATMILAAQECLRQRENPPRHLKPEPTSKETTND